jgi:F-type H+-transporting ATPase subunit epsilon
MSPPSLRLEIVTPDGVALEEREVDVVVVRRREPGREIGSEVAIYPFHEPLLVRMPVAPVRYHRGNSITHVAVAGGFAEVVGDRVVVVTPRCQRISEAEADPRAAAEAVCRTWRQEVVDLRYPVP